MLSVIVITKNEACNIERCLKSVEWADEIIVLDSGSSDNTVDICKRFTDNVFVTDWPGFGPQKQRALEKAKHDWVLSIDADEIISESLKHEILQAIHNPNIRGYELPRLSSYCGRPIRHAGWWPDYVLRLFRRDAGRFSPDIVHELVIVDGNVARLTTPIEHEAFIDAEEVLDKINVYSSLGAKKLYEKGVKASLTKAILKGAWTFFRTYFVQAAFLDGPQGLMLAISNAEGTYYKYLKLHQLTSFRSQP